MKENKEKPFSVDLSKRNTTASSFRWEEIILEGCLDVRNEDRPIEVVDI